ncbi:MAG: anaerobic ribonucleoside-triphosphate reductase activating protein [Muribaculaceae bacterium]|nr:anaerobic ribonucleoside-triphosphate reductase activating protein [Muribaculaceae bacterium]
MNRGDSHTVRIIDIIEGTSVDGPGLRTSIYFAGCLHQCPGCQNPQSWPMDSGTEMTIDEIMKIVEYNDFNVTFSGGDPLYQVPGLIELAKRIKTFGKNIWLYTGFTFEEIKASATLRPIISLVDAIVDGPFIESLRDETLLFRGSSNQRIIDCQPFKNTMCID